MTDGSAPVVRSIALGSRERRLLLGLLPFAAIIFLWWFVPQVARIPAFRLPPIDSVIGVTVASMEDGSLIRAILDSLNRLLLGFLIGNAIAIPLGIAIAVNRKVSDFFFPTLGFLQSIAGIAWIPLAIIWFGIGDGAVIFVVANTIFFSSIFNTTLGVRSIPPVLFRAMSAHGANRRNLLFDLIIPGALAQILVGLRTSMAFGWRALVAGEMLAGTSGLGYLTIDAVQWYQTEIVVRGMILIGILWIVIDRTLFKTIETRTAVRWGLVSR